MLAKVYKYAYHLKASGKTATEITQELLARGLDNKSSAIIAESIDKSYTQTSARYRKKYVAYALFWCFGGLAVITFTYFGKPHNSSYPYFLGTVALLLGISRLILNKLQKKYSQ